MQGIYEIMKACWQMEPNERPPFTLLQQMLAKNFGECDKESGRKRGKGGK